MAVIVRKKRLLNWVLGFLFWTLIGLSFASQFYLSSSKVGRPISWGAAISWSLGDWYVWALLSIPIMSLARRFRVESGSLARSLPVHLAASALFSLGYMVVRALLGQWQSAISGEPVRFSQAFHPLLVKTFQFNLLIYWVIVSVTHALDYHRQFQERELRSSQLEKRLTQARLHALQMQLNPHFLFNTLHAISALMHRDVDAADRMLTRLGDLLRLSLEKTGAHEVLLRQEIDFLQRYLEIEQTRFGNRLAVRFDITPESLDALVPNFLLQPLVENAVHHGIEPRARPGEITIKAARSGAELHLAVRDNGVGLDDEWRPGVGVSNTQARLLQLYGRRQRFEIRGHPEGGVIVSVVIPFQPQKGPARVELQTA